MDDGSIPIGLLMLFVLCLAGSFFFSATEMAFSSVSRVRIRALAEGGNPRAKRVLSILDDFDMALTALLIGNNVVNIGCATIATIVATQIWGLGAATAATLLTTVLLFMLGESLPKTLSKANSEKYAMATVDIVRFLMRALHPLIALLNKLAGLVSKPFRREEAQPTVTEEELRDILEDAVEGGVLKSETGALVKSALRYGDASVRDILTPWKKVEKLPISMEHDAVVDAVRRSRYSRIPVIDDTGDAVGFLRVRKYLKATLRGREPATLADVMEPAQSIPVTMPVDALLPLMSAHRTHVVFVRDEWENVLGIVTVEDILESLVGDIWDEEDIQPQGGDAG